MGDDENNKQTLPAEIEQVIGEIVQGLPEEKQNAVSRAFRLVVKKSHSGPLPDPESFEQYSRLIPNGADRLMKLVENQAAHRQTQESRMVYTHRHKTISGQWIAAALSILFGLAAYKLGMAGHDVLAGTIATSTIGGIIAVFVLGQLKKDDDEEEPPPNERKPLPPAPPPRQQQLKKGNRQR